MSVHEEITKYVDSQNDWTFAGKIEDYIRARMGHKASNASRRCRELVDDKILEVRYVQIDGKGPRVAQYRIKRKVDKLSGQIAFI